MPKDRGLNWNSTDEWLTSVANSTLDSLASVVTGNGLKTKTTRQTLDRLSLALAEIDKDDRLWIEKKTQGFFDQADGMGSKFLSTTGERLSAWVDRKTVESQNQVRSRTQELIRGTARAVGALLNEERGSAYASGMISLVNQPKVPNMLRDIMSEVVGMTAENEGVLGLVNKVKAGVSKMRQAYREEVPKLIAAGFSRELTAEEWSALHLVYGKSDSGVLQEVYGEQARRRMMTDKRYLENEITQREEELKNSTKAWATYQRKASLHIYTHLNNAIASNSFQCATPDAAKDAALETCLMFYPEGHSFTEKHGPETFCQCYSEREADLGPVKAGVSCSLLEQYEQ